MKILLTAFIMLAAIVQLCAQDRTTISGRFLDEKGKAVTDGSVAIFEFGGEADPFIDTTVIAADGSFTLHADRSSLLGVRLRGPEGLIWFLPPVWARGERLGMSIRLRPRITGNQPENPEVRLDDSIAMEIYNAYAFADARDRDFMQAILTHQMEGKPADSFTYDFSDAHLTIDSMLAVTPVGIVRDAWRLVYISISQFDDSRAVDTGLVRRALGEIAPASILWAAFPKMPIVAVKSIGEVDGYRSFLDSMAELNPIRSARATFLYELAALSASRKDTSRLVSYIRRLEREFPTSFRTRAAHAQLDPDRAINVGRRVPAFAFASLDDSTRIITDSSLIGRYYLIDFWATWCTPCVAELGSLHKAYDRFHDRNFEVLSLSFDQSAGTVTQFRKRGRFPMPWKHAFIEGNYKNPVADLFNVTGIPRPILIGPDGTILVTNAGALRGENLEKTLAKYLGD